MIMGEEIAPDAIVEQAQRYDCKTIAYTYTEPTVYLETALETSKIALDNGLRNVFVTNGYMSKQALDIMRPYLSAANVDLKSFREEFYKKQCGAKLGPVLDSLKKMKDLGIWVEITTLLIPGLNDSADELKDIAAFIADLGKETPWHISRFHPQYKMLSRPVTPVASLHHARDIGKAAGLRYVYSGNVPGDEGENTYCFKCSKPVITRYGYRISDIAMSGNLCSHCGQPIDGIF